MAEKYKYEKRYWYPHMGPQDVAIWERFIDRNPGRFDECVYDLPVGAGADLEGSNVEDGTRFKEYLTKYKCDVIAFKGDEVCIIEVKPRAGLGSIGQIINYADLYIEYVDRTADPTLYIVTDALRTDMDWLCEKRGIKLTVV